jgi:hypothetical protein
MTELHFLGCRLGRYSRKSVRAPPLVRIQLNFLYLFYRDFAKIYGSPQILKKYTSAVVTHGVRDITPEKNWVRTGRTATVLHDSPGLPCLSTKIYFANKLACSFFSTCS